MRTANTSAFSMATISQGVGLGKVTIDYSRPALKGRKMFGDQVPYGKVWRTGANMATKLTLDTDMTINGKTVPAGSYALLTIPGECFGRSQHDYLRMAFGNIDIAMIPEAVRRLQLSLTVSSQ